MSPTEKALELIEKYKGSKENAVICAEEVLNSWKEDGNSRLDHSIIDYWEKVIVAIKTL